MRICWCTSPLQALWCLSLLLHMLALLVLESCACTRTDYLNSIFSPSSRSHTSSYTCKTSCSLSCQHLAFYWLANVDRHRAKQNTNSKRSNEIRERMKLEQRTCKSKFEHEQVLLECECRILNESVKKGGGGNPFTTTCKLMKQILYDPFLTPTCLLTHVSCYDCKRKMLYYRCTRRRYKNPACFMFLSLLFGGQDGVTL